MSGGGTHTRDDGLTRADAAFGGVVVVGVYFAGSRNENGFTIGGESNAVVQLYLHKPVISTF